MPLVLGNLGLLPSVELLWLGRELPLLILNVAVRLVLHVQRYDMLELLWLWPWVLRWGVSVDTLVLLVHVDWRVGLILDLGVGLHH